MRATALAIAFAIPIAGMASGAHTRSSSGTSHWSSSPSSTGSHRHRASPIPGNRKNHLRTSPNLVRRDASGRIHRDPAAKAAFRRNPPCPSTGRTTGRCPGYEVDHVRPLACGGADSASNMQWLTAAANQAKGSEGCRR